MSSVNIKWNGDEVKLLGKKAISNSIYGIGLIVEGNAKSLAPIDTGRLASSITTQSKSKGTKPSGKGAVSSDVITKPADDNQVFVGTPVQYAPYMEFGTIRTNYAQPFLRPALRMAQGETLTIVRRESKYYFKDYLK